MGSVEVSGLWGGLDTVSSTVPDPRGWGGYSQFRELAGIQAAARALSGGG